MLSSPVRYLRTDLTVNWQQSSDAVQIGSGAVLQCRRASLGSLFQCVSACHKADGQLLAVIKTPSLITVCNWISFEMYEWLKAPSCTLGMLMWTETGSGALFVRARHLSGPLTPSGDGSSTHCLTDSKTQMRKPCFVAPHFVYSCCSFGAMAVNTL